jgi:osmotically inducible protein OsmC
MTGWHAFCFLYVGVLATALLHNSTITINSIFMKRRATAVWNGTVLEGSGNLTSQSKTLDGTPYSYKSRFADGTGTNPEELLAAAHAGCFTMKLSLVLTEQGFPPKSLETAAAINLEESTLSITESKLKLTAVVPGISREVFDEAVKFAELNCPISKVLKAAISVEAQLVEG